MRPIIAALLLSLASCRKSSSKIYPPCSPSKMMRAGLWNFPLIGGSSSVMRLRGAGELHTAFEVTQPFGGRPGNRADAFGKAHVSTSLRYRKYKGCKQAYSFDRLKGGADQQPISTEKEGTSKDSHRKADDREILVRDARAQTLGMNIYFKNMTNFMTFRITSMNSSKSGLLASSHRKRADLYRHQEVSHRWTPRSLILRTYVSNIGILTHTTKNAPL
jgi:hypothetical protein